MIPSAEQQLLFLQKIQLLLDEASTNTTYKFALLLALADLSVEEGDNLGTPLTLSLEQMARKFIRYYWSQSIPYHSYQGVEDILKQHHGRQAAIISKIVQERSNQSKLREVLEKQRLVNQVAKIVNEMPLWRLQNLANGVIDDFLYEQLDEGTVVPGITLRAGVAYCFRVFHSQIVNMVQGTWVRWIRNEKNNHPILGQHSDLSSFLFGNERKNLSQYVELLTDIQHGTCFYCGKSLGKVSPEVDHFIPWSRYPIDFGHNFVLAHKSCNNSKSDWLASIKHLAHWVERNEQAGETMEHYFDERQITYDLPISISIARWAYDKVESMGGDAWLANRQFETLTPNWRSYLE